MSDSIGQLCKKGLIGIILTAYPLSISELSWAEHFPIPKPYCTAVSAIETASKRFKVDFYKRYSQANRKDFERYFPLKIEDTRPYNPSPQIEKKAYVWVIHFADHADASQGLIYAVKRDMTVVSLGQTE